MAVAHSLQAGTATRPRGPAHIALLFLRGRENDLNIRGAFLHMAADALVSLGVVIAGVAILWTGAVWIDPAVSLLIVLVIAWGTWGLLKDSVKMSLLAVPRGISESAVRGYLTGLPGVEAVHDLHIWPMSTTETALTAHLVMPGGHPGDAFLREIAEELGLGVAGKKDSQEICFVTQGHHSDFVRAREPERSSQTSGEIITTKGEIVGQHAGYEAFTIGQRKGLGVAMGTPFFVTEINPQTNQVVIGSKDQLAKPGLTANEANWLVEPTDLPHQVSVQIRYNAPPQPAQIRVDPSDKTRFSVDFDEPQLAVAPGQAAVVYDGPRVLGGGWIE